MCQSDVLIIGCGIGGATAALELARDTERQVTLITRTAVPADSNSSLAQGGIVSIGVDDSTETIVEDLLDAGAGLSRPDAARLLATEGPTLLHRLADELSIRFDRDTAGELAFGLEGAHSRRRILHVGDTTGKAVMRALLGALAERPNVRLLTDHTAVDLITFPHHAKSPLAVYDELVCHGAYVLEAATGQVSRFIANHTILATGGAGGIYLHTTNPPGSRGDGLAMAARAGVRLANLEYVQFHPTALHMPGKQQFLISEAVRGEGGVLLTPDGDRFMERYTPERMELASRDVVSRAIYDQMLLHDYPHVLLDIASRLPADAIRNRFAGIHAHCKEQGLDITRQPIPVVPAAHYFCGGVLVDTSAHSSVRGLYVVGETACTGVHGANRLASTSLLEGLVWGVRAARDIRERPASGRSAEDEIPAWHDDDLMTEADPALIQGDMQTIRNLMWHYVGLVRSEERLNRATRELVNLRMNIEDFYRRARVTDDLVGLRNSVQTALLVAWAAQRNRASRGCHYREDGRAE
ncbi:MAG: L-aspartate oxidase [Acidobacteria bacterium]|nr:L-aspartate oxidase [Acidobacteriota bacterium]NIM63312.1 L-aspartate oxidase [Acidobacteriota bacterium]NIO60496.1 L-aspartate oxidase [Acidobacteriota bacterium]NIQ31616.1 L-aspartate oxidase [Acidobacteriota bacterium]NIQ87103.1 L-aspartate oxidase [Acidobacteriota bacterium]